MLPYDLQNSLFQLTNVLYSFPVVVFILLKNLVDFLLVQVFLGVEALILKDLHWEIEAGLVWIIRYIFDFSNHSFLYPEHHSSFDDWVVEVQFFAEEFAGNDLVLMQVGLVEIGDEQSVDWQTLELEIAVVERKL